MKELLCSILCLFCLSTLLGQIDNSDFKVEISANDLGVCGDNSTSDIIVTAKKSTLADFEIVIDLPDGVNYVLGTAVEVAQSGGYTFSVIDDSDPDRPRFGISNGGTWAIGDEFTFRVERTAGCGAVQFKNDLGGIFKDAQEIYYTDAGVADSASDYSLTIYTYNLLDPSISIQSVPTASTSVGDTETRDIEIEQGGQGCLETFSYYVTVSPGLGSYQLSYNGTILVPTSTAAAPTGDTLFYSVDLAQAPFAGVVGNGDLCWENGETIIFTEQFETLVCDELETRHHSFWGCTSDVCQVAAPQSGGVTFDPGVPDVTITEPVPVTIDLCDTIRYTARISNSSAAGTTIAYDLNFFFGQGVNNAPISSVLNQTLWGATRFNTRNWGDFEINGNPITLPDYPTSNYNSAWGTPSWFAFDTYTTDPDGPGTGLDDLDGDGFFDDLAPGEFFDITFDFWVTPRSNCGTGRFDYLGWEHHYFDVTFFDQCGDLLPDAARIDFDYRNFIRDHGNTSNFNVPSDIDDGVPFGLMIEPYLYTNGVNCHGQNALTGAFAEFDVRLFLPTGISLASTDAIDAHFSSFSPTKTVSPGVGGDTIIYALNRYNFNEFNFQLELNCAAYLGAGGGSLVSIPYETNYYCDNGSGSCWEQRIHCGSFSLITHCIGGCFGPSTTSFDADRTTAGFTDETMTTQVSLDPLIHDLDQYNAGDTMLITSTVIIVDSAVNNLFFDIDYTTTAAGGGTEIIEYVSGEITIDDISTGTFVGDITSPPSLSNVGNARKQTFDLSSYTSYVGPSYEYGEGDERDTITVVLKYVFSKNFNTSTAYELVGFRGRHYAIHPVTLAQVSCDSYGDRAYYHRLRLSSSTGVNEVFGCNRSFAQSYNGRISAVNDVHPNEYRPPVRWDSTLVILPPNAAFSGKVDIYDLPNGWQFNINSFTLSGDSMWVYMPPLHRISDLRTIFWPRVRIELFGSCESPAQEPARAVNYLTDFFYHPNTAVHESRVLNTTTVQFRYTPPDFLLQSPTPNENGFATTVSWDVELCNNSTTDVDYNWFRVAQNPGIQLDSIVHPTLGQLNMTSLGGFDYVELGALGSTPDCMDLLVYANYSDCSDRSLTLEHGWDCNAYPIDFSASSSFCYQESIELIVEPREAQIQLSVTDEPASVISLCSQFEVGVEFISAQISDVNDPFVTFTLPGSGTAVVVDSVTVEYPRGSGDIQQVPASLVGLLGTVDMMAHSAIAANDGLLGTENALSTQERIADITFYFQLGCDFPSGTSMDFTPFADSPCGDPAIGAGGVTTSNAFFVNGAIAPYDAFTSITPPDSMSYCGTSTIDFATTIVNGTTGSTDSIQIDLPAGLEYIVGSFNCTGSFCPTAAPEVNSAFGFDRLIIDYPSGVPNGGVISFTIDVEHSLQACADIARVEVLTFSSNAGLSCASSTCATTPIPTGTSAEDFVLIKPEPVITAGSASSALLPNADLRYSVELTIENQGLDALDVYDYAIYCGDGSGGIQGPALFTGTLTTILLNSESEMISLTFDAASCPSGELAFTLTPTTSDCICPAVITEIPVTVLPPLPDSDGDNVVDDDDLDDDNDGIPDLVECPVPTCDTDGDGVDDQFDLDSDNDGVFDLHESGHYQADANNDGRIDGADADFGINGLFDGVETSADSGSIDYIIADTDNDGTIDAQELDSDGDGCDDVIEAGFTDPDSNGLLGNGN